MFRALVLQNITAVLTKRSRLPKYLKGATWQRNSDQETALFCTVYCQRLQVHADIKRRVHQCCAKSCDLHRGVGMV
ncbi:hypothetical protein TUN199_02832 [Pyrenophora tritici-repentis]|nr:hypothetical protein Alg130_02662 [Pyrenophora tritici-repentis]KAI0625143.1 hypothetical protein TUN199_02832 [Pyrenophora tritici-repentis]